MNRKPSLSGITRDDAAAYPLAHESSTISLHLAHSRLRLIHVMANLAEHNQRRFCIAAYQNALHARLNDHALRFLSQRDTDVRRHLLPGCSRLMHLGPLEDDHLSIME
ncbi:unnamed protein product [Protopolystoma xenopodis]|uniref:Uncharacterized protein n=1 Tax=Protopolystoma xenopodis TaxID=117903 RepID=A0A448XL01_9PLAT|nr:unnamed protein product [Protopolystoma xenopodis]